MSEYDDYDPKRAEMAESVLFHFNRSIASELPKIIAKAEKELSESWKNELKMNDFYDYSGLGYWNVKDLKHEMKLIIENKEPLQLLEVDNEYRGIFFCPIRIKGSAIFILDYFLDGQDSVLLSNQEKKYDLNIESFIEVDFSYTADLPQGGITPEFKIDTSSVIWPFIDTELDIENYLKLDIDKLKIAYDRALDSIKKVKNLLKQDIEDNFLFIMLHGHLIAILEAFLERVIIDSILDFDKLAKKYVNNEKTKSLKVNFALHDIVNHHLSVRDCLKRSLDGWSFHNTQTSQKFLKMIFDICIDNEVRQWLQSAVAIRHHCVHRAGWDKESKEIILHKENLDELLDNIESLIERLYFEIYPKLFEIVKPDLPTE